MPKTNWVINNTTINNIKFNTVLNYPNNDLYSLKSKIVNNNQLLLNSNINQIYKNENKNFNNGWSMKSFKTQTEVTAWENYIKSLKLRNDIFDQYCFGKFINNMDDNLIIYKKNINIAKMVFNLDYLKTDEELNQLNKLCGSINNLLKHSVIYSENNQEKYLDFIVKTSQDKPYEYYSYSDKSIKQGDVIKLKESSYLSSIKYRVLLPEKSNNIFKNIKNNQDTMEHYCYNFNNIQSLKKQIDIFNSINNTVDVTLLVKSKYSIIFYTYDLVYNNYVNGNITKEKWDDFLIYYKTQLKELHLSQDIDKPEL
jgi:hypothetical protein